MGIIYKQYKLYECTYTGDSCTSVVYFSMFYL